MVLPPAISFGAPGTHHPVEPSKVGEFAARDSVPSGTHLGPFSSESRLVASLSYKAAHAGP